MALIMNNLLSSLPRSLPRASKAVEGMSLKLLGIDCVESTPGDNSEAIV
jgi:hypothetical protein